MLRPTPLPDTTDALVEVLMGRLEELSETNAQLARYLDKLETPPVIGFSLLDHRASLPSQGSPFAAGYDLTSIEDADIFPGSRVKIKTGVAVAIPEGHAGFIWPRSGLAVNKGIDVMAGLIDADYRGEIEVVLINHSNNKAVLKAGDRIAQIVFAPHLKSAELTTELGATQRGDGGFGSTDL